MKENFVKRFLKNNDRFGHSVNLSYKGRETYTTVPGGMLSLMVSIMTIIMIYQAIIELIYMNEPIIKNISKPLTKEEKADLIPVKLNDYNYVLAVQIHITHKKTNENIALPAELAEISSWNEKSERFNMVNCTEVISEKTLKASIREDL